MDDETRKILIDNPMLNEYLKRKSYLYKNIYRDKRNIKEIIKEAKIYFHETSLDKLERLQNNISLISTFLSAMK